ncbi:hypothetical protein CAPTEDRAFT_224739 [Capitella teleta]|uniref:SUEL-type lectin domain-containing protein n=1 Tax=Capitella teleta TaxID=283909 RepID=R7UWT2_CAPTE|nr:hypothetical protein CAPTEDRAFT_224739 [Capitella teleta]|eukprot:ELU07866.1 hypothetical protein CAPTEDRAFT_224739 [Capitella teleta]
MHLSKIVKQKLNILDPDIAHKTRQYRRRRKNKNKNKNNDARQGRVEAILCTQKVFPWGRVISDEYCDHETFQPQCNPDEHIVIISATYGHMQKGKCIELDTPYFGCQVDVKTLLGTLCSEKISCSIRTNADVLRSTKPCSKGITVYLDATYACIKAVRLSDRCEQLRASSSSSYISSAQSAAKHCTQSTEIFDQEFNVQAESGQQVHISLIDLLFIANPEESGDEGEEVGYVLDPDTDKVVPVQRSQRQVETILLQSEANTASIALTSDPSTSFVIAFKAVGCADLMLAPDVWIKRDGDVATVGCHSSQQTWRLHCLRNHWTGVIGNCTKGAIIAPIMQRDRTLPLPKDVVFVIIGCCTLFVAIGVVTMGYVCLKWPKKSSSSTSNNSSSKPGDEAQAMPLVPMRAGQGAGTLKANTTVYLAATGNPRDSVLSGDYEKPIYEKPLLQPTSADASAAGSAVAAGISPPLTKRNNDEVYNMSLSSNSTDYEKTKKYFVLDKDYINMQSLHDDT